MGREVAEKHMVSKLDADWRAAFNIARSCPVAQGSQQKTENQGK
jgi:hypothetical protein